MSSATLTPQVDVRRAGWPARLTATRCTSKPKVFTISVIRTAEYDEALTLSTAFWAAGAVTVIGSRWEIPDSATSVLMFMFHLRMTKYGNSPRDALRLAQAWMLNSNREIPEEMPYELIELIDDSRLRDVIAWAGFVHQGR